jgi:hypothetical protein
MITKINEHLPTPKGIDPYRRPSETVQSPNQAGGEVPRDQWQRPVPRRRSDQGSAPPNRR